MNTTSANSPEDEIAACRESLYRATAFGLQEAVYYAYGAAVEGDIIEFGTMSGRTARAMAIAMLAVERQYGLPPKHLHLYDSFEGLPKPDAKPDVVSPHVKLGHWAEAGCRQLSDIDLAGVLDEIVAPDRYSIVPGWFSETLQHLGKEQRFSLVHVDCDLYGSTMDALAPLFAGGHISEGAAICFDDWMCNRAGNDYGERKAVRDLTARFDLQLELWGAYSWSASRFIVHSYRGMPA